MIIEPLPVFLQAWEFLRRNPQYRSEWGRLPTRSKHASEDPGFPVRRQTQADLRAGRWGLLAYRDPGDASRRGAPFWSKGPALEAVISEDGDTPLLPLLRESGARVSGLRLLDGGLLLQIERNELWVRLRFRDGGLPDESDCIELRLPFSLPLAILPSRAQDLWTLAGAENPTRAEAATRRTSRSFLSRSTARSPGSPNAKSPSTFSARKWSRRNGMPTAGSAAVSAGTYEKPFSLWRADTGTFLATAGIGTVDIDQPDGRRRAS